MDEARGEEATQCGQQQECILSGEVHLRHRLEKRAFQKTYLLNFPYTSTTHQVVKRSHFWRAAFRRSGVQEAVSFPGCPHVLSKMPSVAPSKKPSSRIFFQEKDTRRDSFKPTKEATKGHSQLQRVSIMALKIESCFKQISYQGINETVRIRSNGKNLQKGQQEFRNRKV